MDSGWARGTRVCHTIDLRPDLLAALRASIEEHELEGAEAGALGAQGGGQGGARRGPAGHGGVTRGEMDDSTIACRRCGRVVTAQAPRCPECGADPRTGMSGYRDGARDRVRVCEGVAVRFYAFALDFVILCAVFFLIGLFVYLILVGAGEFAVVGEEPPPWPLWVVFSAAGFLYFWVGEARWTRTLGKRLFDLRVVRTDGGRVGYGAAFVRTLLRCVDWLPALYLAGAIAVSLTPKRQRLGDLAARTVVVRPRTMPAEEIAAGRLPTAPWPGDR